MQRPQPPSQPARTAVSSRSPRPILSDDQRGALVVGGHHGADAVRSSRELEDRFPLSTLRHAAQCVGLDYTVDIQGSHVLPGCGSLAEIEPQKMFQMLLPYHDDEALLKQLVGIASGNAAMGAEDAELSATHLTRRQSMSMISLSDLEQREFVVRLHRIYRNPNEHVPLEAVKLAEVALRRYNAKQKETESSLRRVFHACLQLEEQQQKYHRHGTHTITSTRPQSAPGGRAVSVDNCSSLNFGGGGGGSGSVRHPTDAVGKLLFHLKRQALSERNNIRREIAIRASEATQQTGGSSSHSNGPKPSSSSEAGTSTAIDNSALVSARRHRKEQSAEHAFEVELEAHRRRTELLAAQKLRQDEMNAKAEDDLALAQDNADRRRYEFLRNRELRLRASSERCTEATKTNQEASKSTQLEIDKQKKKEQLARKEERLARAAEEQRAEDARKSAIQLRQQRARDAARALEEQRVLAALEQEQEYLHKMEAHDNKNIRKAAAASIRSKQLEQARQSALDRAKRLEAHRVQETEALRNIIDTDQERRKRQTSYLKSIKNEENKIKEEQRRRLVQQYAKAREYREQAFRTQWENDLQRRQEEERTRKQFASSLHQLQLREEAKLRGIIGAQQFSEKDIQKLDRFIAEIDALTASPARPGGDRP
ncbi:Hypothetical protein, putative [Bodo saltans]|uniref:Uncharacterized protein n=1 Tax=Bodo saltans TaxID=75058 RepID=A0A0S4JR72_BODSA|nr:Hypothetical protein, putative [Bodo saltans]|eukprot:CUG94021.1 Hypothetical protein, putative [Bodo saltans]